MNNQHRWTYPAPHGKRIFAFLIDSTIAQIIAKGFIYMSGIGGETPDLISGLITLAYFTFSQAQYGWTPGKKMLGLEVVSRDSDERPSFLTILGRESIGRMLTVLTFGIGYLMIFTNSEREGLHDRVFKTQVISLEDQEEEFSILKWILAGFGTIAAFVLFCAYVLLYTPVPLTEMAKRLEAQGVKIDGIEGNLMNGFSVAQMAFSSPDQEFIAENLVLDYESWYKIYTTGILHIRQLSISKLNLKVHNLSPKKMLGDKKETNEEAPAVTTEAAPKKKARIQMIVDRIDINNLEVSIQDKQTFKIERFFVSDLDLDAREEMPVLKISRLWFDNPHAQLDLNKLKFNKEILELEKGNLIVRKTMFPEHIAGDIDVQFQLDFNLKDKQFQGNLEAFRKSLKASYQNQVIDLQAKNLQPHWFLKNIPPIHSVNLQMKAQFMQLLMGAPVRGSYSIRNKVFQLSWPQRPGQILAAESEIQGKRISSQLNISGAKGSGRLFDIILESPQYEDISSALSELYYGRNLQSLTPAELTVVQGDGRFFSYQKSIPMLKMDGTNAPGFMFPLPTRIPAREGTR